MHYAPSTALISLYGGEGSRVLPTQYNPILEVGTVPRYSHTSKRPSLRITPSPYVSASISASTVYHRRASMNTAAEGAERSRSSRRSSMPRCARIAYPSNVPFASQSPTYQSTWAGSIPSAAHTCTPLAPIVPCLIMIYHLHVEAFLRHAVLMHVIVDQ